MIDSLAVDSKETAEVVVGRQNSDTYQQMLSIHKNL